jgi:hypothetical protein
MINMVINRDSQAGSSLSEKQTGMRLLKASVLYFALIFGAGCLLGAVRVLWFVPRLGSRAAELVEMPIMLVVTIEAASWITRRLAVPRLRSKMLAMGAIALALMLIAEFTLVLWLRGLSIRQYLASRDRVAASAYYVTLLLFGLMPLLLSRMTSIDSTA